MSTPLLKNTCERTSLESCLDRITDLGIAAVLFVAPLVMAGRFAPGRLVLAILVSVVGISWCVARWAAKQPQISWRWTQAEGIVLLACAVVLAQLVPLSADIIQFVSPGVANLLPIHFSAAASAETSTFAWHQVSLAPHETRGGLAMLMIYAVFFFVLSQRLRSREDLEQLMKSLALAGVFMATLGLLQYAFGNGKFLWLWDHPSRDTLVAVKGTFVNENHFAHFLALCLGPLLWWITSEHNTNSTEGQLQFGNSGGLRDYSRNYVGLCIGLAMVIAASLLTYSVGGMLMILLSGVITTCLLVRRNRLGKTAILVLVMSSLAAVLVTWLHGQEILQREFGTVHGMSGGIFARLVNWKAVLTAAPEFAILGSGIGSHRFVYPSFLHEAATQQFTHAESGYLHMLLESGSAGLTLLLVSIGVTGRWIADSLRQEQDDLAKLAIPLAASWCVSVIHGVFDFNWFIPANMCVTLAVVAMVIRLHSLGRAKAAPSQHTLVLSKPLWCVFSCVVFLCCCFSVDHYLRPAQAQASWFEFRAWSLAAARFQEKSIGPGGQRRLGLVDAHDPKTVTRMMALLDETLQSDPWNGRAHRQMAAMCLHQFELKQQSSENPMSLADIRDAALNSEFQSHQAMDEWVTNVLGSNRVYLDRVLWHCRQAAKTTPTEGDSYLYLSEVAFLDEELFATEFELTQQALALRPQSAVIQFAHGRQLMLADQPRAAMQLWHSAFRRSPSIRQRIIESIAFQTPPDKVLELFQPDLDGLRSLFHYYRLRNYAPQMNYVGSRFVVQLEDRASQVSGAHAGELWLEAQFVHGVLGNAERALKAATNSIHAQPTGYDNHYARALRLRALGQFEDAAKEFRWCYARRPEDQHLPQAITEMQRAARTVKTTEKKTSTPRLRR